jgi:hypothetical protein
MPVGSVTVVEDETVSGSGDAYTLYLATVADAVVPDLPTLPTLGSTAAPYRVERPVQQGDIDKTKVARLALLRQHAKTCTVIAHHAPSSSATSLLNFSPVNNTLNLTPANNGGNFTVGCELSLTAGPLLTVSGIRFYWSTTAMTVRCSLWEGSTRLAMVDFAAPGAGIHEALFASPYNVPATKFNRQLFVTVWHASNYPKVSNIDELWYPPRPFFDGGRLVWKHWGRYGTGDAAITSSEGGCFPVEPILETTP